MHMELHNTESLTRQVQCRVDVKEHDHRFAKNVVIQTILKIALLPVSPVSL